MRSVINGRFRVQIRVAPLDFARIQPATFLGIEIEIVQAGRVAGAAGMEREVMQPAQLVAQALVPARFGNHGHRRRQQLAAQRLRQAAILGGVQVAVVAVVAAEQLIAAVAADHHLHVLAREFREQPGA